MKKWRNKRKERTTAMRLSAKSTAAVTKRRVAWRNHTLLDLKPILSWEMTSGLIV